MDAAQRGSDRRPLRALAVAALVTLALSGCGSDTNADEASADAGTLAVQDAWVRASAETMTAAFGVIANETDTDCTVVSATTSASATAELHEVVMAGGEMTMRPKEGGFAVPAGSSLTLEPGGPHVMIMDLAAPLAPGDDVTVTLTCEDSRTVEVTAQVRESGAGDEEYHSDATATESPDAG